MEWRDYGFTPLLFSVIQKGKEITYLIKKQYGQIQSKEIIYGPHNILK